MTNSTTTNTSGDIRCVCVRHDVDLIGVPELVPSAQHPKRWVLDTSDMSCPRYWEEGCQLTWRAMVTL